MMRRALEWFNPAAWWNTIQANPVILKEMRSRMRGWKSITALTAFLVVVGGTIGMIYFGFVQSGAGLQGVTARKSVGQSIFFTIYIIQLLVVALSAPTLTSGAIASEREAQTYDLLRTTLLSARALVTGKLVAAVAFVLLLLLASLPLQSIGFIFGGISIGEIVVGSLILLLTALNFGAVGLFFSSIVRRSRIATVLSQITTMSFTIALPIAALFAISILDSMFYNRLPRSAELVYFALGWLVMIGSPIATAITTEIMLIEEQTFFFFQLSIGGSQIWVPSPWLGFTILYLFLAAAFLFLAIRVVRQPEKQ